MSNSERHKERRKLRSKQAEKENRMHRNALRNKTIIREKPQELIVKKKKESFWTKLGRKLREIPRKIIPTKGRR